MRHDIPFGGNGPQGLFGWRGLESSRLAARLIQQRQLQEIHRHLTNVITHPDNKIFMTSHHANSDYEAGLGFHINKQPRILTGPFLNLYSIQINFNLCSNSRRRHKAEIEMSIPEATLHGKTQKGINPLLSDSRH